jgi:hypothetical protein
MTPIRTTEKDQGDTDVRDVSCRNKMWVEPPQGHAQWGLSNGSFKLSFRLLH